MPEASPFSPWQLNGLRLRNRVIKEATFEAGCDREGVPTEALIRFHEAVARGGAALTTVAYASVSADGRSFETQLLMSEPSRAGLQKLTDAVHRHGGLAMVQLTHAGGFADRSVIGRRQIAPSAVFNPAGMNWPRPMSVDDVQRVTDDFARAASLAVGCGFDAIEVHAGHGYLLSQFLSPYANKRTDAYGCRCVDDRVRFPLAVCRAVRRAVGGSVPIVVKLNLTDGFSGGVSVDDAADFALRLEQSRLVDLLIPSGGWVSRNGFFMLRGGVPLRKMVLAMRKSAVKRLALAALGRWLVPAIAYEPRFFEAGALDLLRRLSSLPVCLLGGVDSLGAIESALAQGFAAVAIARPLLREPDFLRRLSGGAGEEEARRPSRCTRCNECVVESAMAERPLRCTQADVPDW